MSNELSRTRLATLGSSRLPLGLHSRVLSATPLGLLSATSRLPLGYSSRLPLGNSGLLSAPLGSSRQLSATLGYSHRDRDRREH